MILRVFSEGSYGSNLVHINVGSVDSLAQRDLHITEQVSNRILSPYLYDPSIPNQPRRNSSRPNAILITTCPANPYRPTTSPSHRVLRSMRDNKKSKKQHNSSQATS
eukprot:1148371-Pelagomonas_calceolata.AAC.1